jgi:DNA-binding NarL/FixJ family response regulator
VTPRPDRSRTSADSSVVKITKNQREILIRLFAGSRESEIAVDTDRRPSTIFNTVRHVRERLGVRTEYDLMRECLRRRIVTLDEIFQRADSLRCASARDCGAE